MPTTTAQPPLPLRHPGAFYDGHIPTFAINVTRLDYCVRLGKGESIWAESSFKYEHEQARLL